MSNSDVILSQIRQRLEILYQMVDELEGGGGGGSTTNYNDLTNKPSINNQVLTGNKSLSDLGAATPSDITDAFTPSTITLTEGGTFPSGSRTLLTEHKPINVNDDQYYFLEESGVDYLYGSMPTSGAYPSLSYLRVMKSTYAVEFHNTGIDTVPTEDSANLITSGAVYDAVQGGGGGTDLTPVNVGSYQSTFPEDYMYVLQKHLPFVGAPVSLSAGIAWFFLAEDTNVYYYIQPLIYGNYIGGPIRYRKATINKTTRQWTQQNSSSNIEEIITDKTLPDYAFKGHNSFILATQNLNNLGEGLWYNYNSTTIVNAPTTNPFFITVEQVAVAGALSTRNYRKQTLTDFTTNDVYYRTYNNGTWSSWYKITATVVS